MDQNERAQEALFRFAVLGPLLNQEWRRGALSHEFQRLAQQPWIGQFGKRRRLSAKTIQAWYYRYKKGGFEALCPDERSDLGKFRALEPELQQLILDMKKEDPGRAAALIRRELVRAGRIPEDGPSLATFRRLLKSQGLSGPQGTVAGGKERLRWEVDHCGELWQGDCLHGPALKDSSGHTIFIKIFGLLDDHSRLAVFLYAFAREAQAAFLTLLMSAVLRRGIPKNLYVDNHGSLCGNEVEWACARLGINLLCAPPYDAPAKGKLERFWRTLRADFLERLDLSKVTTLDEFNLRLCTWVEGEYHLRPHAGLQGQTPMEVWEKDVSYIRWVEDPEAIDKAFTVTITRQVYQDSTCKVGSQVFEAPAHLRGGRIVIYYTLLHPDRLWIMDGKVRVFLRPVDVKANARRRRRRHVLPPGQTLNPKPSSKPLSGYQPVEDLLRQIIRGTRKSNGGQTNPNTPDGGTR